MDIWAKGSSRDPLLVHLVHSIFFCAASHQFSDILVPHIRGRDNSIADALSHFQMLRVPSTHPTGRFGTHYPASLSTNPLVGHLAYLKSQAIAPSTRRTYSAGIRWCASFCHSRQWTPFPASELQLRYFASWLCDQVGFPTIKLYLAGIWFAHLENSLADPFADAPLLHLLL